MIWLQPGRRFIDCAVVPAENITRVSIRRSAAFEQADPIAIPTSIELIAQGLLSGFSPHVFAPQYAQFKPKGCRRVPMRITASACSILSASRRKNIMPRFFPSLRIFSDRVGRLWCESVIISIISTPLPLGAVRAAIMICLAASSTISFRMFRSL